MPDNSNKNDDNTEYDIIELTIPPEKKELIIKAAFVKRKSLNEFILDVAYEKAQEILVKNCLHTDKDQVLKDDALFLTCVSALAELIPIRESKIKKY